MRLTNLLSAKGATKQEEGKAVEFEEVEEEGEEKEEADTVEEGEEEGEKTAGFEVPVERAVVVKKKKKMEEGMLTLEVAKVHEMEVKKMSITMDNDMCIDQMVDCVQHIFIEEEYSRYFNVGSMDKVCIHCDARYWVEEQNTKKQFTNCCESGKISIPPFSEPPEVIRGMLWGLPENATKFLSASRRINTAVSFASIHMKGDRTIPATVPTIRVNGSVYQTSAPYMLKIMKHLLQNSCNSISYMVKIEKRQSTTTTFFKSAIFKFIWLKKLLRSSKRIKTITIHCSLYTTNFTIIMLCPSIQ